MLNLGKILIIIGVFLVFLGLIILIFFKLNIPLGKLPGDIYMKKDNFTFYFPITTSILISIILSLLLYFIYKK